MKKTALTTAHTPYRTPIFGNLRVLCVAALLAALSIVLGKYLSISTPLWRISFENLPILMAGVFFGPLVGGAVGVVADLIGCVLVGYTINPLITLGAGLVGVVSGLVSLLWTRQGRTLTAPGIIVAVAAAHVLGSLLTKSWGLALFAATTDSDPLVALYLTNLGTRTPMYLVIGAAEAGLIILLNRNRLFMGEVNRLIRPRTQRK